MGHLQSILYIRGALINQKAYLAKKRKVLSQELVKDISRLEAFHKATRSKEVKKDLDILVAKLKMTEAISAANEIISAKQQVLEYRDKPNRNVAGILTEVKDKLILPDIMYMSSGSR